MIIVMVYYSDGRKEQSRGSGEKERNGSGRNAGKKGSLAKREGKWKKKGREKVMFCKTCKMLVKVLKNKDFYRGLVGVLWGTGNNLMHNTRGLPQNSPNFQTF